MENLFWRGWLIDAVLEVAEIDGGDFLGEAGELNEAAISWRGDERVAIENQFVIATNGVAINDGGLELGGDASHEFTASVRLADVVGRGTEIEQKINALLLKFLDGIAIVERAGKVVIGPNVFTDGDAEAMPLPVNDVAFFARFKVAKLVKHIVSGEQGFVDFVYDLP